MCLTSSRLRYYNRPIQTGQGESDRVEVEFRFGDKIVEIRRTTTKPALFGSISKSERKCQLPFVLEPKGKKDAIGIVEGIDSKTNTTRTRIVRCNFRANVLELAGEVHSTIAGNINLTGQWKRMNAKN